MLVGIRLGVASSRRAGRGRGLGDSSRTRAARTVPGSARERGHVVRDGVDAHRNTAVCGARGDARHAAARHLWAFVDQCGSCGTASGGDCITTGEVEDGISVRKCDARGGPSVIALAHSRDCRLGGVGVAACGPRPRLGDSSRGYGP